MRIILFRIAILAALLFTGWPGEAWGRQEVPDSGEEERPSTLFAQQMERLFSLSWSGSLRTPFPGHTSPLYMVVQPGELIDQWRLPDGRYAIRLRAGGVESGVPVVWSFEEYTHESLAHQKRENWDRLMREAGEAALADRGLLDFSIAIPGGRESAFTTVFGRPEVNLRIQGVANMNAGVTIQHSADPSLSEDQQTRIDPTFEQNLQLNIQGTIGDKLTIQTDWDTERAFDFQNRFRIFYEGYEDEIVRSVEMGNISMDTGNSLIRGSGSLFGIKSIAELGALRFTSVVSQQKGQSNVETIRGGSQEQPIRLKPAGYENDRHFFLDFYTRQEFEESMANPQQGSQTLQISELNVWVLREQTQTEESARQAVALADYGVVENPDGSFGPPSEELDRFDPVVIDSFRDPVEPISASALGLDDSRDMEMGYFTLLREGQDYTVNTVTGTLSLNRSLGPRDVLAVSFSYIGPGGETVTVGDVNQGGSGRLFLKMLRSGNMVTDHRVFPLTMRNVYSLGVGNLTRDNLDLEILFTGGNIEQNHLPGRSSTLLQDLGLDRVDSEGALNPDNQVDFGTGTLDALNGRIIFPWLEPFGSRIEELLLESGASQEEIDQLAYRELYSEQQQNASRDSRNSFYRIDGRARGGVQENYTLGIALVEGSVRVFANGSELQEDVDFQVDYSFGSITILNSRYTAPGQDIRIEYEEQALATIEQKTFTGMRAEYRLSNDIQFGGTYFRYSERPLEDKIRIGDEPIRNVIIGLDANARIETPMVTRALDAMPFISTLEPSELRLSGEFAQLRPGVSETRAVRRAVRNNELYPDEEEGVSFVDDFEGSSISINLLNATRWHLAAPPSAVPGFEPDEVYFETTLQAPSDSPLDFQAGRADLRSKLSWYTIPRNISTILPEVEFTPESRPVRVRDVFPGRETRNPQEEIINTLDLIFDPQSRGPYNYNMELRSLLEENSERTWGGMTAVIPSGQEDFTQNNVEFLEFWVQPLLPGGRFPAGADMEEYDGTIYIDIGLVSEDVIPNAKLNTEDGLAVNLESLAPDRLSNTRSYIPANPVPPEGEFSLENRELEDVGLDGIPGSNGFNGLDEQTVFSDFIDQMRGLYGESSEEFKSILEDPSNDQYRYYGESEMEGLPLHRRFHRMLAYPEGNTPLDQSDRRAVTNRPNSEGLVNPSRVELSNAYFQYEVALNPADDTRMQIGGEGTYIVDMVPGSRPQDRWYQVRIPLSEFERRVGDIQDFQNISYVRFWMSGYSEPLTLRFASFEFVGSQWQKAEEINEQSDPGAGLRVSTINIEENSSRRPIPYRQPFGAIRAQNRGTQLQSLANEQSIVLEANNLGPGAVQLVQRSFPGGMNMLNYSNMRMFVHGEGFQARGDAELVMRFGNDLENSYYEYRQPVTPTRDDYPFQSYDPAHTGRMEEEAAQVWKYDENSMNLLLTAFNQLKQLRNLEQSAGSDQLYERADLLEEAVPGAVIAIRGNPSLDRVMEIGMGIRNPYDLDDPSGSGVPVLDAQLWLNELRVSGFDNRHGWAANARADMQFADVATIRANFARQTDGFGALDSRLGQRRISDQLGYDLGSTLYLHSFIPDRYSWNLPVSFTHRRNRQTPRYLPNEGDVRLSEFMDAVNSRQDIGEVQKNRLIDNKMREVQTYNEAWSLNLNNLTKRNSVSALMRYTLDNLTFNYVYNNSHARNPQNLFQDNWNYNASVRYSHTFRQDRFMTPLSLFSETPFLRHLSGFQMGYAPDNITASISTRRVFEERRRRVYAPDDAEQPLQQTHNFNYSTLFGFDYSFTRSITTGFQARGIFDLNRISLEDAGYSGADSDAVRPIPTHRVLNDLLTRAESARRSNYQEDYTATWRPELHRVEPVNWIDYTLQYGGGFRWENTPSGSQLGSRVSNSFRLDHTLRLDIQSLSSRSSFLAVTRLQSTDITWVSNRTGTQAGYAGGSGLIDMLGTGSDFSPSPGYRLGFTESISPDRLIGHPGEGSPVQIPSSNTFSDRLSLTARFLPFANLSVELTWATDWDERETETLTLDPDGSSGRVSGGSGNVASSTWAFGGGYRELFERQLQTAFVDIDASADSISDARGSMDGRTVLNRVTLQEDFRYSYLSGSAGGFGDRGFTPLSMPSWRVNWTGLEEWIPWAGRYMQRASVTHAYTGTYRLGWIFNNNPGPLSPRRIGTYVVEDERPEFEPNNLNIEKRFAPVVQLNVTWNNSLRTQIGYEFSELTSFALSNMNVTERISKGMRLSAGYTVRNFRMPLFGDIGNNLDITLTGNIIEDSEQRFLLDADLERALSEGHETIDRNPVSHRISPRPPSGLTRLNGSLLLGYRFSNRLQANFEYNFTRILPKSSRTFERTIHDIRFNIRIHIQS
ncbi:MAG: cell surface protein SprA [Balneolaceae bacterium]